MKTRRRNGTKRWVPCRVYPGMFSNERTVEVLGRSFFVEEKSVRNVTDDQGELEVMIVEIDGREWAVIPTNTRDTIPLGA
jgi:hypothetical protein